MSVRSLVVRPDAPIRTEELASCSYDGGGWLWTHGHVDKRKFKGACLSQADHLDMLDGTEKTTILRAKVKHGWVLTIEGDPSGCGGDYTVYLVEVEPVVKDGLWWNGDAVWNEDIEDEEQPTISDGPHEATWVALP